MSLTPLPARRRRRSLIGAAIVIAFAALLAALATPAGAASRTFTHGGAVHRFVQQGKGSRKSPRKSAAKRATTARRTRKRSSAAPASTTAATAVAARPDITAALFENKDYPYANSPAVGGDIYNMGVRQCTSYAAWALTREGVKLVANPEGGADVVGPKGIAHLGDAWDWDENAAAAGFRVDNTPAIGAIAQWDSGQQSNWHATSDGDRGGSLTAGHYGHVGVVIAVNPDGTARVRDYNGWVPVTFNEHSEIASRYIHFVN